MRGGELLENATSAKRLLLCSFRQMEKPVDVVALTRVVGGGKLTEAAQAFFLDSCMDDPVCKRYPPHRRYTARVLKELILATEGEGEEVLEEIYDRHSQFLLPSPHEDSGLGPSWCHQTFAYSIQTHDLSNNRATSLSKDEEDSSMTRGESREGKASSVGDAAAVCLAGKELGPGVESGRWREGRELLGASGSDENEEEIVRQVGEEDGALRRGGQSRLELVTLRVSLNMLEGGTGCTTWGAGFYLADVLLTFPQLVEGRTCLELGSGAGLVGVCLSRLPVSNLILTDGDHEALLNLRHNLAINDIEALTDNDEHSPGPMDAPSKAQSAPPPVRCLHVDWEVVSDKQLRSLQPNLIIGADIVYDARVIPHLVRVLALALSWTTSNDSSPANRYPSKTECLHRQSKDTSTRLKLDEPTENSNPTTPFHLSIGPTAPSYGKERSNFGNSPHLEEEAARSGCEHPMAYIASTVRNEDTMACFLRDAKDEGLEIMDVTVEMKPKLHFQRLVSQGHDKVRLHRISAPLRGSREHNRNI